MVRILTREQLKAMLDRREALKLVMAMDQWHFDACRIPGSVLLADKRDARTEIAAKNVAETFARMSGTEITFGKPRVYVKRGQSVSGY